MAASPSPAPTRKSARSAARKESRESDGGPKQESDEEKENDKVASSSRRRSSSSSAASSSKHTETALLQPQAPYPAVEAKINDSIIYAFFRYCAERHKIYHRKEAGVPAAELSEDQLFVKGRYGNVFRQLDRGSAFVRDNIINKGDQSNDEICFRVFLYNVFSNTETYARWEKELGEVPSLKNFDVAAYTKILDPVVAAGGRIYSSGFQLVPPTNVFPKMSGHAASLRLLKLMVDVGLAERIQKCKYIVDASALVQTLPTLGGFLSLNLLCYLNESPHINLEYRDWASCGPGARETLAKIFGHSVINSVAMEEAGLLWLKENQWRYWARLGENPPQCPGIPAGMRVLDFENALCWHHRYMAAQRAQGIPFSANPEYDAAVTDISVDPSKITAFEKSETEKAERAVERAVERAAGEVPAASAGPASAGSAQKDDKKGGHEAEGAAEMEVESKADNTGPSGGETGGGSEQIEAEQKAVRADSFEGEREDVMEVEMKVEEGDSSKEQRGCEEDPTEEQRGGQRDASEEQSEGVYEIEKIVNRRPNSNSIFRVRWAGYPPEEDTWEHTTTIEAGGKEALDEFRAWITLVEDMIAHINKNLKFKTRFITKGCDIKKKKASAVARAASARKTAVASKKKISTAAKAISARRGRSLSKRRR